MDNQRTNRESGGGLIPIVRLVSLMLLGVLAAFLLMPARQGNGPRDLIRFAQDDIAYAVTGAIGGLLVELWIRRREKEK